MFIALLMVLHPGRGLARRPDPWPKAPKWPRGGIWLQEHPRVSKIYSEKVTLVYFWDYTSVNCMREIPVLKRLRETYRPHGFQLLWVHAPEFDFAKRQQNVARAVGRFKMSGPVYLDNEFKMWEAFGNRSWPTKYVVNHKGRIVHTQIGEGYYKPMEDMIRRALRQLDREQDLPDPIIGEERDRYDPAQCGPMTTETYTGYGRAGWWGGQIANRRWMAPGTTLMFHDRGKRVERGFFAHGLWQNREDDFLHGRDSEELTDYLGLSYVGREVYVVAHRAGGEEPSHVYVTRDEEPIPPGLQGLDLRENSRGTYFLLNEPRLYYLIQNEDLDPHELKIWPALKDVAVNSFSFANLCLADFERL